MNVHETAEIRELTGTELDHVSGGVTFAAWMAEIASAFEQSRRIITGPLR